MKTLSIVVLLLIVAAGGAYWMMSGQQESQLGLASARTDGNSANVNYDWALADGELMLGTSDINVPRGINVHINIDNDRADTLLIQGYDIAFELAADSLVPVTFYTHKNGRYGMKLKSSNQPLGTLTVVDSQ